MTTESCISHRQPGEHCFKSGIKGIVWPAIQSDRFAQILALQFFLDQNQWLTGDEIKALQFLQCRQLLWHAKNTVPYYKDILQQFDLDTNTPLTQDVWLQLPILKRPTLLENINSLHSTSPPEGHGQTYTIPISAAAESPAKATRTGLCQNFSLGIELRNHIWHQVDPVQKIATIRFLDNPEVATLPDGIHTTNWGEPYHTLFETGPAYLLTIESPIKEQAEWLLHIEPEILVTTPSNLLLLSRHLASENRRLTRLQQIMTISEVLNSDVRKLGEQVFQVPIIGIYSKNETGYLALQCPVSNNYHIQSESVLLEILDNEDKPCEVGDTGRMIVTDLHNFAMPLIRYEIGDDAEVGDVCECGRGLPVLKRIHRQGNDTDPAPS